LGFTALQRNGRCVIPCIHPNALPLVRRRDGDRSHERSIALQLGEALRQGANGSQLVIAQVVGDQVQPPDQNDHGRRGENEGGTSAAGRSDRLRGWAGWRIHLNALTTGHPKHIQDQDYRLGLALNAQSVEVKSGGTVLVHQDYTYQPTSGRLGSVTYGENVARYSYVANLGLIEQISYMRNTDAVQTGERRYDQLNRLSSQRTSTPGGVVFGYGYRYNAANQRSEVALADGSHWAYGYDALGQVNSGKRYWTNGTTMPVPGQQFEYTHDDIGNRTSTRVGGNRSGGD
jgi:YD repeat-containing protein